MFAFKVQSFNEANDAIAEQIGILAVIETEAHFFEIRLKMLRTRLLPATAQAALEQG